MPFLSRLTAALLTLTVVACAPKPPPPPPPPTIVELSLVSDATINPAPGGQASPVTVSYYQLVATDAFDSADYFQIHGKEAALLGKNLLDQQDVPLPPATTKKATAEGKPGVQFLGVIVSFRDIDHATWRASAPIPPNKTTKLKIVVSGIKVAIQPDDGK